jgi:hypothetical protein
MEEGRSVMTKQEGEEQVSFDSLFTLPFALHLRPLPHVSYMAEQDSGQSSEQDDEEGQGSDLSSCGSNYRAGTHRLEPHTHNVPPHSLKTISMLLERTRCLDAVSAWSELIEMLDKADDDPHFTNLRAFFDARFDRTGRRVDVDSNTTGDPRLQRSTSRRKGAVNRAPSTQSPTRAGTSSNAFGLLNRRQSSRYTSHEEDTSEDGWSDAKLMRAPEIIVVGRHANASAEGTRIPFKVRLDLHRVGLAPKPPLAPSKRATVRASLQKKLASSPSKRALAAGGEGNDLQRVLSASSSSDHSHTENLSLHPVRSPDSFRSRPFSDGSDDYSMGRRGSDAFSATSVPAKTRAMNKASRNSTTSSAVTASMMSELGTSPPDSNEGGRRIRPGLFGSFSYSKNVDGSRRPSMIQRLMDFKGLRGSSQNSQSKDSLNSQSNDKYADEKANVSDIQLTRVTSPDSNASVAPPHSHAQAIVRARSHTGTSDLSNEDALDLADEETSNPSVSQILSAGSNMKRRTSSGAGPHSMLGYTPAPDMLPVDERMASSNGNSVQNDGQPDEDLAGATDFITLLRRAANTSLAIRPDSPSKIISPTRTPRGLRSAGSASLRSRSDLTSETPPGSVELEEQERVEALLAPFKQTDPAWWLSGAVDPLPISIACALSQALGWNGVMDLCYGKQSRSARAKIFQPLGRAAELERKMEAEKARVQNWAQSVAAVDDSAGPTPASTRTDDENDDVISAQDIEARDRLASMQLSKVDSDSEVLAPSESASAQNRSGGNGENKISTWLRKKSGGVLGAAGLNMTSSSKTQQPVVGLGLDNGDAASGPLFSSPFTEDSSDVRSWQDWAELSRSMANWLQEYETTRVRNGMAGEFSHEVSSKADAATAAADGNNSEDTTPKIRYASQASYQVPLCVVRDALDKHNGFRRRHGIPEGLPVGPDGQEIGDYRWARKRLSTNHFATSTTLAVNSLAHCMQQLATSDWTHASAWELDYLEMCVFKNPIMAKRFPSPASAIVPADQTYRPSAEDDQTQRARAKPCPYPSAQGAWSSSVWLQWLRSIGDGMIIVPAVSWQAWWTLIAVLNGGDGSDRALDVQLKAEEESFSALNDTEAVYL